MKNRLLICLLIGITLTMQAGHGGIAVANSQGRDEAVIADLEAKLFARPSGFVVGNYLAAEFISVSAKGESKNRAEIIAAGPLPEYTRNTEFIVNVHKGHLTANVDIKRTFGTGRDAVHVSLYHLWVKRGGRWQLIFSHVYEED